VAFILGLLLAKLLSAGCILWARGLEKATKLQSVRLWACRIFLLLTIDLTIVSGLQPKLASKTLNVRLKS
jgi:lysylphosphatidylglycerol synthetase-like protein (DUF2156 family)